MVTLTYQEAFKAMFFFLEQEYELSGGNDYLGGLLGSMSWTTFEPPGPADPGAWEDWLKAIAKAKKDASNLPDA